MNVFERSVLERVSRSQAMMEQGSTLCEARL